MENEAALSRRGISSATRTAVSHVGRIAAKKCIALFASALLVCAALFLAGCSSSSGTQGANGSTTTVSDAYGRSVTVPANVKTCATVGSAARFVVYAGGQDKLIAVTEMDAPASPLRPYTEVYAQQFAALPTTSNGNHLMETSVDAEALLKLDPDVIISSRSAQECNDLQEKIGIPVVGISYQDKLFAEDVYMSIEVVGETLGTGDHAANVVKSMKAWAEDLQKRTALAAAASQKTAYVGGVNYKGAKSFGGTYCHYAPFDAANVKNVADEMGTTGSVDVSLEQLGEWDPDFMFLNMANKELLNSDYAANKDFFNQLKAFRTGALYSQPSFNYNGTNIEMGICDAYFVGSTVYPDAFADVDIAKKYDEIFTTMLGEKYYETMKSLGMDFVKVSF